MIETKGIVEEGLIYGLPLLAKEKEANWRPAPNGPIYLVMRLYWPKESPPSILRPAKGTWQPPALVKASSTSTTSTERDTS